MKISKIEIVNFKYFDNLTINVPLDKRVILLVGPNGCGKSCIFDAFTNYIRRAKRNDEDQDYEYLRKEKSKPHEIKIYDENNKLVPKTYKNGLPTGIYGRTAFRYTKEITRNSITKNAGEAVKQDKNSFLRLNDLDQRIEDDIEAALGEYLSEVQKRGKTTDDIIDNVINPVNNSLIKIFGKQGIQIQTILNPFDIKGSEKIDILFVKNNHEFVFKNLSAGEKEIFDIIFNFFRRVNLHIKDGVYFIDEPELHIHTNVQRKLIIELVRLCKKYNSQLWIATHSIGFIRAAHQTKEKCYAIYEFTPKLSTGKRELKPAKLNWNGWQRLFKTPLDDIANLTLPQRIIYCEGDPVKTGFDEKIYNRIFGKKYDNTIFISGGGTQLKSHSLLAAQVFEKLSSNIQLLILKDRDLDRIQWLKDNKNGIMLERKEIENYLLDIRVLKEFYPKLDEIEYNRLVKNIYDDDMKAVMQKLKQLCKDKSKDCSTFLLKLARHVEKTVVYKELKSVIFY